MSDVKITTYDGPAIVAAAVATTVTVIDGGSGGGAGGVGPTGPTGPTGPAGADGAPGPKGDPGAAGATGATGAQGIQGVAGSTGPSGVVTATAPATYNPTTQAVGVTLGTTGATAAAGDDSRITGATQKSANLSDLASAITARTNLGLGTAATVDTGTASGNVPLLSTGGVLPIARIATGAPDGTKFVRDDGTLAAPASGGGTWTTYTPTVTGVGATGVVGRYLQVGKRVDVTIALTLTGAPTTNVTVSLPVAASTAIGAGSGALAPKGVVAGLRTGVTFRTAIAILMTSTTVGAQGDNAGGTWSPGNPVAWASGDVWGFSVTYEAA